MNHFPPRYPNDDRRVLLLARSDVTGFLIQALLRSIDLDIECDWVRTPEEADLALISGQRYDLVLAEFEIRTQCAFLPLSAIPFEPRFDPERCRETISKLLRRAYEAYASTKRA